MKKLLILSLFLASCSSVKTVTATVGTGIGAPNTGPTEIYDRNVTVNVNGTYSVGYGRSMIFGEYGHLGVSHNGYYVGYTNYHNDWGSWVTVKKTIPIFTRKDKDGTR